MRKRDYRRRLRKTYYEVLDQQVAILAKAGFDDPLEGSTLRELLAVVLEKDRSFGPFFSDQEAQDLQNDEGWARLRRVCAGRIVERYLFDRTEPAPDGPAFVLSENLGEVISELIDHAVVAGELSTKAGEQAGEALLEVDASGEGQESARVALEEILAADVNLAAAADDEDGIPETERELEITKSALLRLRMGELRKIAEVEDLPLLRGKEDLAAAIVRRYKASRKEIAQLVLEKLPDGVESGHTTHLIQLTESPDLDTARARLSELKGHYLRLEVAHWLVFTEVADGPSLVRFSGQMRYYDVAAQREGGEPEIAARRRRAQVEVRLRKGVEWVEIDGRNLTEIRRIRSAFGRALDVHTRPSLSVSVPSFEGVAGTLDRNTLLMLSILETGLRDELVDYASFTAADFAKPAADGAEAEPLRPSVRQVKLSGNHILSSPDACRLIAREGQKIVSVEFRARYRRGADAPAHFSSVRISLFPDQATIMTSYGGDPTASGQLHTELTRRLRRALDRGIPDATELSSIVQQMVARAEETGDVDTVDILAPADGDRITAEGDTPPDLGTPAAEPIHDGSPQ